MKKSGVLWVIAIIVTIVGIAVIDVGVKRPINWKKTYNLRDKTPFGLYVLRNELPNILGKQYSFTDYGATFYEEIQLLHNSKFYNRAFIAINEYSDLDKESIRKIITYTKNGGEVFISAVYHSEELLDTLEIYEERLDYARFLPTEDRVTYSLGNDTARIKVDKITEFRIFSKLDADKCTILGYLHSRGRALPNYIKVAVGRGHIYLHCMPEVFSNYHILQESKYDYVSRVLSALRNKNIMFSDLYFDSEKPQTPLRVILTKSGFNQAWYLLLFGLLILLVFKSKREQRAVQVIKPEENLSKEFAKTIGSLYYENGNPGNIIQKKIDYFLYALRSSYHIDTLDLLDEKFLRQLSLKSGVSLQDTKALMQIVNTYKSKQEHQLDDVKHINSVIEDFKQKTNIS